MTDETINPEFQEHKNQFKHYMRDIILGVNDGLVSIFLLVAGIAGAGVATSDIILAGLAATIAGAISMMAGEYISTKSQEEVYQSEIDLEKEHIKYHKEHEIDELYEFFGKYGFEGDLLEKVVQKIAENDKVLLDLMLALEFGILENERRSPLKAMATVGVLFTLGALPPLLPFFFVPSVNVGMGFAIVLSALALFGVGAAKTFMTATNWITSGFENLLIGVIGAGLSFLLGSIYGGFI